jgi:hypothetical protein
MTAPVASGWIGRRVGLAPTGERRLLTAHTQRGRRLWAVFDSGCVKTYTSQECAELFSLLSSLDSG